MTLIKSISGIRGTISGLAGENLTPLDIASFSAAFGVWAKENYRVGKSEKNYKIKVVEGLDAWAGLGIYVTDIGIDTTLIVEIAVTEEKAAGGIIITASHNPANWNALKLLNQQGEFIPGKDGHKRKHDEGSPTGLCLAYAREATKKVRVFQN